MREAVVFLPGLLSDARLFGPQIADLSRDLAVMVVPTTDGERIEEIASGILDVVPKRFALAGHGFGGVVAMELIRRAPERVTRLALMNCQPLAPTPQQAAALDPRIIRTRAGRFSEAVDEEIPADCVADGHYRMEIMALVSDMAHAAGPEIYTRQVRALQRTKDQQSTLRKIVVPSLVLCGDADPLVPVKRHSAMAELIPSAQLTVLEGVGHFPTLEAPDAVGDALRSWLSLPLVLR